MCRPLAFVLVALVQLLIGCSRGPDRLEISGPTMGTTYTVRITQPDGLPASDELRRALEAELARVDEVASRYRADSEVVRFNQRGSTDWIDVSPELAMLVSAGRGVAEQSRGAFDLTLAPVIDAWGFGPSGEHTAPSTSDLQLYHAYTGYQQLDVSVQPPRLRKHDPRVAVDLNAIAPGYAVDRLAARLDALGARNYLVDIGGEIRVRGMSPGQRTWRIAVEDPRSEQRVPLRFINMKDGAIATSGGARHFVEIGGQRYAHVLDARTRKPVSSSVAAVTVIATTAMDADAWATALYALGLVEGMQVAREQNLAALFLVNSDGDVVSHTTPAFDAVLAR